jgi:glycerol uptake facilitator-like aquaporin
MWLALFEWLGTGLFLLGINYSEGQGWIIVTSLFIAAILTGRVGGGHFNMGVTVAVYIIEGRHWKKNFPIALTVIIADILGAYTGIAIACGL